MSRWLNVQYAAVAGLLLLQLSFGVPLHLLSHAEHLDEHFSDPSHERQDCISCKLLANTDANLAALRPWGLCVAVTIVVCLCFRVELSSVFSARPPVRAPPQV